MRLIDADKIRYRDMSGGSVPNGVWYTFLDDVEKTPTVRAIPIEWIRNYVSHWVSEIYKNFVLNMIKTWEKENESNISN